MEIIVPIRQVPDVALNIRVNDGAVVEDGVSFVISSWDETALEAALQMTEELGGEVTLLGIGPERVSEALRKGLAMGAHKAIHIQFDSAGTDSFAYAKILAKVLEENPDELKRYHAGKKALFGFFMGEVMKVLGGKSDPKVTQKLLTEALKRN